MKQEQRTYQCQAAGRPVKLTRQTFYVSGIGDEVPTRQRDHGCDQEHVCPHRYTDACEVQRRNR
ncbi:hypothetical protein R2222_004286 [Cronobacter sakazakii]|uniref:hypothetical protein n=1 Tax=Klebsiella pneumoniae TaxID=573 RepID=UPI000C7A34C2|nr:hypothetical protein [Klebsiella pneumoniae]EKZ8390531.1 hypothetical protein [Salmonella enterica subsp. enterica serovar Agona]ELQ6010859.1 hypothetical protein [Cronobacter sakazakii]ELQ6052755.1 hypothetical protein [Cronobacter sakazakii]PLL22871.1 hypothetical protein CWN22_24535 [Klebsiella pneumoniae]PLP11792.1 hypothetical protein CWN14_11035 [Klebsiella pneumoniae]